MLNILRILCNIVLHRCHNCYTLHVAGVEGDWRLGTGETGPVTRPSLATLHSRYLHYLHCRYLHYLHYTVDIYIIYTATLYISTLSIMDIYIIYTAAAAPHLPQGWGRYHIYYLFICANLPGGGFYTQINQISNFAQANKPQLKTLFVHEQPSF